MLTAKVEDMDKITGLTLGADEYMTKPITPLELAARAKTQLRTFTLYNKVQSSSDENPAEFAIRGLTIATGTSKCTQSRAALTLSTLTFTHSQWL
mgnify:CR=1 FL=1